ncbi:putative SH3-containing YSC84-like protein 1 [Coleophoma crateriformis]|uniref:Putative SH3-containing YSC84-like protein 1 n=1 Tax=Coleophoma crateriformis TaxID=565419 RepID=A0A3D8SZC5_9HELO|nr:putative SH3-containing YSC84-like protein 1 [Coleophoma crateriformis]
MASNTYPPEKTEHYPPPPAEPYPGQPGQSYPTEQQAPPHFQEHLDSAQAPPYQGQQQQQYPPPPNQPYNPAEYAQQPQQPPTVDPNHAPTTSAPTPAPTGQTKLTAWDKTRNTSKAGFDKLWAGFEKLGVPVNKLTNKIGSEAFWPQPLDKESDKCARILKSFCKDGFYTERPDAPADGPKGKPKVLVKIPQKVIQNAVGLAIFTVMRTGLWISGAGGSGVLISRLPDGSWSPPSGILVHTAGVGFMAGIDIYDCVLVINTPEALAAFKKLRLSLGGELSVAAGPIGAGGIGEVELLGNKNRKPVWTYMKSRGLYAGIQIDGTIIVERNDENARFYGQRLPAAQILAGGIPNPPQSTRLLTEVLKEAEGRKDVNQGVLNEVDQMPPPGDVEIEKRKEPTKEEQDLYTYA